MATLVFYIAGALGLISSAIFILFSGITSTTVSLNIRLVAGIGIQESTRR